MDSTEPTAKSALADARKALIDLKLRQRRAGEMELNRIVRVSREGPLPVTEQQRIMWFLHQLLPETPVYNVGFTLHLQGNLDLPALRQAFVGLIARHESLHTCFAADRGVPFQQVTPEPAEIELPIIDLTDRPDTERWPAALAAAAAFTRLPFDLTVAPLLRVQLVRLGDSDLLTVVNHHIVSDGWSTGIIMRDLAELYDAALTGRPAELPALTFSPVDVAAWQRRLLSSDKMAKHLDFWRDTLRDLPELELPTDRPRPIEPTGRGESYPTEFPPDLLAAMRKLALEENVSMLAVVTAALQLVLSRYTGQDDVAVGGVFSGRTRAELETMVGFLVNMAVLRTDLSGNPTTRELLVRAHNTVLDASAHQDAPFGTVVEAVHPERVAGRNPLFQVSVGLLTDEIMQDFRFSGLTVRQIPLHAGTSRFDLALAVHTHADGTADTWAEYSSELFDRSTVDRLVEHLHTAIRAIVEQPDTRIDEISILPDAERTMLLEQWTPPPVDFGTGSALLHELVSVHAERQPDHPAVRFEGRTLSYRELEVRSNQLAHLLRREHRIRPGSIVGMLLPRGMDIPVAQLGTLKAGGAWLPLDPAHPPARIEFQLANAGAPVAVTVQRLAGSVPPGVATVLLDDPAQLAELAGLPSTAPDRTARPEDGAYLIYTSGSTGNPKGVLVEHRAVVNFVGAAQQLFGIVPADRVLQFANPTFDVSVFDSFAALTAGATCVAAPTSILHDVEELAPFLRAEAVTVADIPPAVLGLLDDRELPAFRALFVGLEAFTAELVNRWRTPTREFHNGYGPTEATVACVDYRCPVEPLTAPPPIGRAMANMSAFVVDRWGGLAPVGVAGELCVAGVGLARGYLGQPALTADRFTPCPFLPGGQRMYHTGDLARWRTDGVLEFLGRRDRQVKIRGLRVELGEVEHALTDLPGITQAAAIITDTPTGPRLDGYYVAEPGSHPTDTTIRTNLARRLPTHMIPATLTPLPQLPLTSSGKLDHRALPPPATTTPTQQPPSTPTEHTLATIWADLLHTNPTTITRTDNFFTIGGSSLQGTQLISRVRDALYVELDPRQLFTNPLLGQLAELIDEQLRADVDEAELSELEAEVAGLSEEELDRLLAEEE